MQHGLPPSRPFRRRLRRQRIRRIKFASWVLSGAALLGSGLEVLGPPPVALTARPVAYVPNALVGASGETGQTGRAGRTGRGGRTDRASATFSLPGLGSRGPVSRRSGQEPRRRWERRQRRLAERRAERRRERRRARRRAERRREREQSTQPEYGGSITETIYTAAAEFGIDGGYLLSVAWCESNLDPGAVNEVGYYGLFQFDAQTWAAYGYGSIWDPVAQARTAARLLAAGEADRWPSCA